MDHASPCKQLKYIQIVRSKRKSKCERPRMDDVRSDTYVSKFEQGTGHESTNPPNVLTIPVEARR